MTYAVLIPGVLDVVEGARHSHNTATPCLCDPRIRLQNEREIREIVEAILQHENGCVEDAVWLVNVSRPA